MQDIVLQIRRPKFRLMTLTLSFMVSHWISLEVLERGQQEDQKQLG
jgi:hypothetical protein